MTEFLSEDNLKLHKDYLRKQKLKYSIIETSSPGLKGAGIRDVLRMKIDSQDKRDALDLLPDILLHEIYFSSFSQLRFPRSDVVSLTFGSEAAMLNELFRLCMSLRYGFAVAYSLGNKVRLLGIENMKDIIRYGEPCLAVDVSEHAYFMDYGFDKERYLTNMLPYLDLTKLTFTD